ncbi:cytochrome p450 [Venturia nashicola]|nr:cytochrome p450 [Venturia nashicola]
MPYYALALLLFALYFVSRQLYGLYKNLQKAKASGIPYVVSPIYSYNMLWLTTHKLWMPLLKLLPSFITEPWVNLIEADWTWRVLFTPFGPLGKPGADTFLIVSPESNMLCTAEAEVINQITTRRNDFPKPIAMYKSLDIYGKNVVTVEGTEWRRHRKVTAPQFNEKSNAVVWKESIFQAEEMAKSWQNGRSSKANGHANEKSSSLGHLVSELSKDTMRLSLHVISRAGFGVRCLWPGDTDAEKVEGSMDSNIIPQGHEMSYTNSLETLLHRILALILMPDWLLKIAPFKVLNDARTSWIEWGKYMHEIYERNMKIQIASGFHGADSGGLDLMAAFVKNSVGKADGLSESEIMGNSFVMFLAGHETAANTIHFCILFLAIRPDLQQRLQAELDDIFQGRPPSQWDYDTDLPRLFSGLLGAIMNEQLRLIPPVVNIPKCTLPGSSQTLTIGGKECIVPEGTFINLNTVAVHRNPKYWPHGPTRSEGLGGRIHTTSNTDNDLEEFRPERWLLSENEKGDARIEVKGENDDVDLTPDTASTLFRPAKGAYIPFSEGFRACLGRRFAQVEILATLAVIYQTHSVELCVDGCASEVEAGGMSYGERKKMWTKAKVEAERKIRDEMGTVITLQLRGKKRLTDSMHRVDGDIDMTTSDIC